MTAARERAANALRFAHTNTGNCFGDDTNGESFVFRCKKCGAGNLCDVCHAHDEPRGECESCPRCHRCNHSTPDKEPT